MEYVIQTKGLTKVYGSLCAVNNLSLNVKRGDIYGLIGTNGAGKTTLMRMLLGLANSTRGEIELFGSSNLLEGRRKVGALIETPAFYNNETAMENMRRFAILNEGVDDSEIRSLLDFVGLSHTGKKKVGQFSLGMRQRLGIAIALLGRPELLILDEPVNGLDPAGIKDVRDIILKLNSQGVTVLVSSHLLDELGKIATVYGIMSHGFLVEELSAAAVSEKCGGCITISVNDSAGALEIIKEAYPETEAETQAGVVRILSPVSDLSEINALLVSRGIKVYQLKNDSLAAEDFFIERMGR
ncbi:MAG: ATP-binding cassette domain-containing protein [Clostridia bacterium]|nr:ATP-binding cassette domain-containing protein [Clostridia bacterium]